MSFIKPRNLENNVFARRSRSLSRFSATSEILQENNLYEKISECKTLMRSFSKEEIRRILWENIGSRNIPKLFAMIEFLEIESGRNASEDFIRNIVLLSILYRSRRGKKEMAFTDLVFQALYKTLSKNSR